MKKILILSLGLLVFPKLGLAEVSPELMKEVEQQIGAIREAMDRTEAPSDVSGANDSWLFRNLWLRLQIPVGFSIPGLSGFSATPEFEMLVQRNLPEGWGVYKPKPPVSGAVEN